jgi:hypothetical protein
LNYIGNDKYYSFFSIIPIRNKPNLFFWI